MKKLYVIHDVLSDAILGGVHVFPADAPAVRFFGDLLAEGASIMARHPDDYQLVCILDNITDNGQMQFAEEVEVDDRKYYAIPLPRVVITGRQYMAAQNPGEQLGLKVG